MELTRYQQNFFAWAQERIPITLHLDENDEEVIGMCQLLSARGLWQIKLSQVKGEFRYVFLASLVGTEDRVDVRGTWNGESETLTSVLASLPRLVSNSQLPVKHRQNQ